MRKNSNESEALFVAEFSIKNYSSYSLSHSTREDRSRYFCVSDHLHSYGYYSKKLLNINKLDICIIIHVYIVQLHYTIMQTHFLFPGS